MAKIGLNYGEKLQIADKTYRVITDGLDVPAVLGKLSFRGIEGPDIIFEVDEGLNTLTDFRMKRKYVAGDGEPGGKRKCHGADAKSLTLKGT